MCLPHRISDHQTSINVSPLGAILAQVVHTLFQKLDLLIYFGTVTALVVLVGVLYCFLGYISVHHCLSGTDIHWLDTVIVISGILRLE